MERIIRKQPVKPQSGRMKTYLLIFIVSVLFCVTGVIIRLASDIPYVPPEFETRAVKGEPVPDEAFLYGGFKTDYGFTIKMAMNLYQQEDGSIYVYFTNPADNEVNLMCEIVDAKTEESLYKSGVIKAGEYVERLLPEADFPNEEIEALVIIYAFEEDAWYSAGTIEISTIVRPW